MPEHMLHLAESALAAGAEVAVHDPWVDPATSPDAARALAGPRGGALRR
ncbi:hypothetical protein [Methanoculleus bourgensis]|uniref:Uncharacterized protein n=1 Tax=Methanoculleus bourgensis TaxID=83986 RepID=A0A0X3BPW3_9EURY|nr:hypothetical protein [Methanoculleus bourgensis]CVK33969.1 conserved protein of unknown function [Methanoculleus bourgensis]